MRKIAAKLQQAMQEQELYREAQLNLRSLSEQIGVSENHVSETLNVFIGQKFFHFVNAHRVQASKQQLIDSDDTILTIANDVRVQLSIDLQRGVQETRRNDAQRFSNNRR